MDAAFNLGILFAGRGEDRLAHAWYERAAAAGHTEAALQVAIVQLREGDTQDAERNLRCAAGGGSPEAAYRLADLLDRRSVAARDAGRLDDGRAPDDESEEWYERAAQQGHRRAQVRVGMFAAARGDVVEAATWYRAAAEAAAATAPSISGCCWPGRGASRRPRCGGSGPPRPGTAAPPCGWRCWPLAGARWPRRRAGVRERWSWGRRRSPSGPHGCVRRFRRSSAPSVRREPRAGSRRPGPGPTARDLRWSSAWG